MTIIDLHFLGLPANIAAFLLPTQAGPILVETGPHATLPHLLAGIEAAGFQATDIQHVFLTHIHLDHAGAAWWFAERGAKVYVHPAGYPHLAAPQKLMESARRIYQDKMDELWGEMNPIAESQLVAVDDGQTFTIGEVRIQGWHTPGHAVHHIAWQVDQALFAGDVAGVKIQNGPVVPPCPPPDIHIEDWQASIARIKNLPIDTLYLTHFGAVQPILPHLDQLEQQLLHWANWMLPYYEQGIAPAEITPLFTNMVAEQLSSAGVSAHTLKQYEAANPSWMSVAGLLRYWRKKLS